MELKGIKMETAKAVPVAERLRAIKIGRYTVDEGSHSKHFAVAAVCQEAAQEIERLQEKVDYLLDGMRDVFPAAHRLALELECLLLDSKDIAAVSKWWDSAHEALEQWREFCREDTKVGADKTANAEVRGDAPPYGAASLSTDGLCSTVEAEK